MWWLFTPVGWAQEAPAPSPPSAELVAPALIRPVTPEYPEQALAERLEGTVVVHVTVAADGTVTEVVPEPGATDVFVGPAVEAARALVFTPALRNGLPVEAMLPVTFRFAPPPLIEDDGDDADIEIEVVSQSTAEQETHATVTLDPGALERAGGEDLGRTLTQVSGVVAGRGSSDASKPIIRGQTERRLLTLFDGVRHESQKWGIDHAPEIDPFAAGSITVVKGASGVRYGPDAIGGVVLVEPPPMRTEPGVGGRAQLVGVSNGLRGSAAMRLDAAAPGTSGLAARVEGNFSRGAALRAPEYVLGNTASQEWNAGARVAWEREHRTLEAAYHHYDFLGGVCYCHASETAADFLDRLDDTVPVGAENWTESYAIDRPKQQVGHDVALARGRFDLGQSTLDLTYAFQYDHRQEYEKVRGSVIGPQYDFVLRTHSVDAWLAHPDVPLLAGKLGGGVGAASLFQENIYRGLPLIPNYRSFGGGVFAIERYSTDRTALELGGRVDHLSRTTYLSESAYDKGVSRGTLDPSDCTLGSTSAECPSAWDTGSVSLGGVWRASEGLEFRMDLSTASRFPNPDELFMNGSAPTSPVYGIGDPNLGVETTSGASPTIGIVTGPLEAELSAYANLIDDYVYFAPLLGPNGEPQITVTIQGAYPQWAFRPIDALFYGLDGGLTLGAESVVSVSASGSIVRGQDRSDDHGLVLVPPDRARVAVRLQPHVHRLEAPFVELNGQYVASQTHVDPSDDLAPAPPAFFLLGAGIGARFQVHGETYAFGVDGYNLLDTEYRDYTSLLRYSAAEPGREVRLRLGLEF